MTKITKEEVKKVALLARLELNENEMKEIEDDINLKLHMFHLQKENSTQRMLRPNMDKLQHRILHKPLVFYFLSEIVVQRMIVPLAMRLGGFRKSAVRDEEGRTLKYWYRESSSTNNTHIVFFHGVGIGVLPYVSLFRDIVNATVNENLKDINLEWFEEKSICVVLASKGYPDKYKNNLEINGLKEIKLQNNEYIFHAGTKINNSKIHSNGGRVLNFVTKSDNLKIGRDQAINLIKKLNWQNGYFRKDIGYKIIS